MIPGSSDFITDGAILRSYKGTESRIIVPEGIETIGKDAFFKNVFLNGLVLPNSLKSIESKAFFGCKNLESVTLNNQITSIGDFAFADCIAIKTINIPDSVRHIGKYAFSYVFGNSDLKTSENSSKIFIELPIALESLGEGSFLGSDGIIIYDNFYTHVKKIDGNFHSKGEPSIQSKPGRALYDPEKASGHWVDSIRFKPHLILIKSTRTGRLEGAVWMSSKDECREYLNAIMDLWETGLPFDFEKYDELFYMMASMKDKINVAFYRLRHPCKLSEKSKNSYEEFLKKHTLRTVETVDSDYKLTALQLLAERNMLTVENIDSIFEMLNNEGNTKCVSWIMNFKNKHCLHNANRLTL